MKDRHAASPLSGGSATVSQPPGAWRRAVAGDGKNVGLWGWGVESPTRLRQTRPLLNSKQATRGQNRPIPPSGIMRRKKSGSGALRAFLDRPLGRPAEPAFLSHGPDGNSGIEKNGKPRAAPPRSSASTDTISLRGGKSRNLVAQGVPPTAAAARP